MAVSTDPSTASADTAGLKAGDRIMAITDKPVTDVRAFAAMVREFRDGEKIELTFMRDEKEQKVQAVLK